MSDEDTAKSRGWKDKDAWVETGGDPDKWRDAATFLKVADEHNGILRENLNRVEDTLKRIQKEREEDRKTFDEFRKFSESSTKKAEERAYQEAKRDYDRKVSEMRKDLKDAVKNGDEGAVDNITTKIDSLEKPAPPKVEDKPQTEGNQVSPDFIQWKSHNAWYENDIEMSAFADAAGAFIQRTKPHLIGKPEFFDAVTKEVQSKFPDKFEEKPKKGAVEGGGSVSEGGSGKKKTWSDLPDDAKVAYSDFKKIMPQYSKEQYLKSYFAAEA